MEFRSSARKTTKQLEPPVSEGYNNYDNKPKGETTVETYATKTLKELFELYATSGSTYVQGGLQEEIQRRLNTALNQLDKCQTAEDGAQVYESFLE